MATLKVGKRDEIDEIEGGLEELRRRFDLYFQGSNEQRRPPTPQHVAFAGKMRRIKEDIGRWNTADRFRFNQLYQRLVSFERMWMRTLQQIEDGTYRRDRFKVGLMKKRDEEAKAQAAATASPQDEDTGRYERPVTAVAGPVDPLDAIDVDVSNLDDEPIAAPPPVAARPATQAPRPVPLAPPSKADRPPSRPLSASDGHMSETRLKQLYDVYMMAKRRTGEQSSLTIDALRQQLSKQVPAIKAKHKCDSVDFKVVLKDGKAMLKAVPR